MRVVAGVILAEGYEPAVKFALAQQVIAWLLCSTLLDGGQLFGISVMAAAGFWAGVAVIAIRRPFRPTVADLAFVKGGYFLTVTAGMMLAAMRGRFL